MRAWIVSTVLLSLLVSGCTSPVADTTSEPSGHSPEGQSRIEAASPGPADPEALRGSVRGRAQDAAGTPLAHVEIRLVGVAQRGLTDATGQVFLDEIRPGGYVLQARREGYQPAGTQITVVAGATTDVQIMLAIAAPTPPAVVDFWQGRERVVVTDSSFAGQDDVLANQCLAKGGGSGAGAARWEAPPVLRFDEVHQLVWPGTASIEVVLDWAETTFAGDEMLLVWREHSDAAWQLSPMTPKGETIRLSVSPEQADSPYQRFTAWQFAVCTKDQSDDTDDDLNQFKGDVHATITLVRGHPLPSWGEEPDPWGNATRLLLVNETKSFGPVSQSFAMGPCGGTMSRAPVPFRDQVPTSAQGFATYDHLWLFQLDRGLFVPPGTDRIEARLEWTYGPLATASPGLFLSYRGADVAPWEPNDPALETAPVPLAEEARARTYSFTVDPAVTDGADDARTAWRFYWNLDGPTPTCNSLEVRLVAEAVRAVGSN